MMHYRPWIHPQQMLMEQHPYYQCVNNDLQTYYSTSDYQEEENEHTADEMPSETSGDQSPNTDMFRLAFAASQWSKLVLNAEGLFNKLMSTNVLPQNEQNLLKNQIEQWLCMKQEYEECIAGDDSGSLQGFTENTRRSLERIEEVTETDEKTDESSNWKLQSRTKSCSGSESETFDEEDQSDTESDSENPDFLDKLDDYMKKFKIETDELIDGKKNEFSKLKNSSPVPRQIVTNNNFVPIVKPIPIRNPSSRRVSILPNSELSNEIMEFQKLNSNINLQQKDNYDTNLLSPISSVEKNDNPENLSRSVEINSPKMMVKTSNLNVDSENLNAMRTIMICNEEKQLQVEKIVFDLTLAHKQIAELQNTMRDKEQFISEMLQNDGARDNAKQMFDKKQNKLEEKCININEILKSKRTHKHTKDDAAHNDEIDKYERMLNYYLKKLKDTKMIRQVVDESAETLIQAKESLSKSKKQLEKLKQQTDDEEKRKKILEDEISINQKKIKKLKEKQEPNVSKLKKLISEDVQNNSKSKTKLDFKDKSLVEVNERVSHLDHLVKEELETKKLDSNDKSEILRQEIISLRVIRDQLLEAKNNIPNDKFPTSVEQQRHLLLIDEYVESIDVMMEQKNVMRCNNGIFNENKSEKLDEQMSTMNRLEILSHDELVNLFYRYFHKVIDLKDSSRTLEIQNALLEDSLKKQKIENDAKIMMLQKSYQRQLTRFYNYYAEETGSSSYDAKIDKNKDFVEQLIKENQALKKRLAHFETLFKTSRAAQAIQSSSIKSTKQVLKPELMQIALPTKTKTKVTRQGNKLIFQTSKKEK